MNLLEKFIWKDPIELFNQTKAALKENEKYYKSLNIDSKDLVYNLTVSEIMDELSNQPSEVINDFLSLLTHHFPTNSPLVASFTGKLIK